MYTPNFHENQVEKPVEHLFTSIFSLQVLSEYDRMTNMIKEELEKMFEDVKEKEGKKTIRSISYYPNGLCEWHNKPGHVVLLKPWQNETEFKNERKRDYSIVKQRNILWYLQFMDHMKKPIRASNDKLVLREIAAFIEKYESLPEVEQKLVAEERAKYNPNKMQNEYEKMLRFFNMSPYYGNYTNYEEVRKKLQIGYKTFRFLNEEQLEDLKTVYESPLGNYQCENKIHELLDNFQEKFLEGDETMTSVDLSDLLVDTDTTHLSSSRWEKKYTFNFKNPLDASIAILDRLSEVEDVNLKKLLKKLGI